MAKAAKVQVERKEGTTGTNIAWRQSGTKLYFGDDEQIVRCDTRQREHPVPVDITVDRDGNLQTGAGADRYYIAQVDIPPIEYAEPQEAGEPADTGSETDGGGREPLPIDMGKVRLTLWGLDNLPAAIVAQLTTEDNKEDEDNG